MSKLVLSRCVGERIRLTLEDGQVIYVTIEGRRGSAVKLSIEAPPSVKITREDVPERPAPEEKTGRLP